MNEQFWSNSWYHVIDGCPDSEKALAYQRCNKPIEVQDFVIVIDTQAGNVYKNKHCAECNNIMNYEKLKLIIDCINPFVLTTFKTHDEREQYVMENCSLRSYPPDRRVGLSYCIPESIVISTCNTSGTWDIYDKDIERGCLVNSYDQNKIFKRFYSSYIQYYANVYCFLCNVDSKEHKIDVCELPDESADDKSGRVSFSFIIDTSEWENDNGLTEQKMCSELQVWDPFMVSE
jgi:hypothetical protein